MVRKRNDEEVIVNESDSAEKILGDAISGRKPDRRGSRRVALGLRVLPETVAALRARAAASGVSPSDYVANAIAHPERPYDTTAAEVARPLVVASYWLEQLAESLENGDLGTARASADEARRVVADALLPLRRQHSKEVNDADPRGWYDK